MCGTVLTPVLRYDTVLLEYTTVPVLYTVLYYRSDYYEYKI